MAFEALFLISIVAGFVGAMSGMGGGVVLIPALTAMGVSIKHAIAVSMVSVIATSSGSASAYVRDRITNLKVGMFLEMFTIVGALDVWPDASFGGAQAPAPSRIPTAQYRRRSRAGVNVIDALQTYSLFLR
jgi:hypothetical protein